MADKDAAKAGASKADDSEKELPSGPKVIMGLHLPIFVLVALNIVCVVGGFGFIYYWKMIYKPPVITEAASKLQIKTKSELEEKKKLAADGALRIVQLPEMNVNLRSKVGGRNHYATLTIAMKCK